MNCAQGVGVDNKTATSLFKASSKIRAPTALRTQFH